MGKKGKVGKQRKDKFYQLAKETGYRSRAAFKLVQLNRRFEFLQQSRVLVDLCAAPGGWLQVAERFMPVSRLLVGVDLAPIKPLRGAVTLQADITSDQARALVQRHLQTWKADCVLHDGAPNVGKNWLHDAFAQARLTLSALRLACQILRKGGWFVTKVFRSKDYLALIDVFKQLFDKVEATKPQASRLESAEIFVVCRGYKQPAKLDPQLTDAKVVFKEELEPEKTKINLLKPEKRRKRAEGYAEGATSLFVKMAASEFVRESNMAQVLEHLASVNQIEVDEAEMDAHAETTAEVRECLRDVKVLGRRELRQVLTWRKKLRKHFDKQQAEAAKIAAAAEPPPPVDEQALLAAEDNKIDEQIDEATLAEKRDLKRKSRKASKERSKERSKVKYGMTIPGDKADLPQQEDLFSLARIHSAKLAKEQSAAEEAPARADEGEVDVDDMPGADEADAPPTQPLLVADDDLDDGATVQRRRADEWFSRDVFAELGSDDEDDAALDAYLDVVKRRKAKRRAAQESTASTDDVESVAVAMDDSAVDDEAKPEQTGDADAASGLDLLSDTKPPKKKRVKLDAQGLALGEMLIYSSKTRRDLLEWGYNRYAHNDDNVPEWFASDQRKFCRKQPPVTKEAVDEYRKRARELDARPIKKVAEAKARKRKREMGRQSRARAKAQRVADNPDSSDATKAREMKKIYSRATARKPDVKYNVVTKGRRGRVARPKGPFKNVDSRLKKDKRAATDKGSRGGAGRKPQTKQQKRDTKKRKAGKVGGGAKRRK